MHNIELFRQLVTAQGEQVTTTSRKIAEAFNKHHYNVLKAIDALNCSDEFKAANFYVSYEINDLANGKTERTYNITKDGMAFLCMGFTGKKASEFKEAYINAFNWMTDMLRQRADIDFMMGDFSRRESASIGNGSFHGRGLAQRKQEKYALASEYQAIEQKLQMVIELVQQKGDE